MKIKGRVFSALVILALAALGCSANPVSGRPQLMMLSDADEIRIGQQTHQEIVANYGIYSDTALTGYLTQVGQSMARSSHRPSLPYSFQVLDSPVVNAFAVPGGYVYLTRGILAYINSEAEMAAVLGHEIGHITARHSAAQISRMSMAQLAIGLGAAFSEEFRHLAGIANAGVSLLFLSFSRDNEREADDLGVDYSSAQGYAPNAAAAFFRTLDRLNPTDEQGGLISWFSTHPSPPDRIQRILVRARAIERANPARRYAVGREAYLKAVNGLVYGEDPRAGYVKDQVFYQPALDFQFMAPAPLALTNMASQVRLATPDKKAALMLITAAAQTPAQALEDFLRASQARLLTRQETSNNGLGGLRAVLELGQGANRVRLISRFIEHGGRVYAFHGFTLATLFTRYQPLLDEVLASFGPITNPAMRQVSPTRIEVRAAPDNGTLAQALAALGVAPKSRELLALLNGMDLTDPVEEGNLLKTVSWGASP